MARLDRLVDIVVLVNREQLLCSIAYFTLEIGEQSPLQAEAEALNPLLMLTINSFSSGRRLLPAPDPGSPGASS